MLRLAKRNYHSLGTFIRLIDYMVIETQVKINQESTDLILDQMKSTTKKYSIQSTVLFDTPENGMRFTPTKSDFLTAFDKILQEMLAVTAEVQRITSCMNFSQFLQGLISDTVPRFKSIVAESFQYRMSKETIQKKIIQDLDDLHKQVSRYEECREVNNYETTYSFPEFRDAGHGLDRIKEMLDKFSKWDQNINNYIKNAHNQGLFQVGGRKLKDRLLKFVKEEQMNMKQHLLDLATDKRKSINDALENIKTKLQKKHNVLNDYVDYVDQLKLSTQEKD